MNRPVETNAHEAGFSLVEVMVALLMTSMLVIAIGGIISFAGNLRERSIASEHVLSSLLDLEALRNAIRDGAGQASRISITDPQPDSFVLASSTGGPALPMRTTIEAPEKTPSELFLSYGDGAESPTTSVDLSAFDSASIDYLDERGDGLAWVAGESVAGSALGARLLVRRGERQWSILLWVVPRSADRP